MRGISLLSYWFTFWIGLGYFFCGLEAAMTTHFVEELCKEKQFAAIDMGYVNAGVLTSMTPETLIDCHIVLIPRLRGSTVLSINTYNLHPKDELTITDSDNHKIRLIGVGFFPDERKSILSDGSITIHYTTNGTRYLHDKVKFRFVFTQTTRGPCDNDEFECLNTRCIKKSLLCDTHNHCGDRSDQQKCSPGGDETTRKPNVPRITVSNNRTWMISIIVGSAILGIVVIVVVAVVIRRKLNKAKTEALQSSSPSHPGSGGSNLPTTSAAYSTNPTSPSDMPPGPHTAVAFPKQLHNLPTAPVADSTNPTPPNDLPRTSYFTQIRRSLRSKINPPKVDTDKEEQQKSENYQVPSMYPHLSPTSDTMDHPKGEMNEAEQKLESHPQVPSMYPELPSSNSSGIDNPDFKEDE